MLYVRLFVKTDTKHVVCPPHPPSGSDSTLLASYFPLLLASGLASSQPWGVWEWRLPVRIYYCPGSDSLFLDTKTEPCKKDEGKLKSWTKVLGYF